MINKFIREKEAEFAQKFGKNVGHHYEYCECGENDENKCAIELKNFLSSSLLQYNTLMKKEIKQIIINATPSHVTREYRDTDKMRDDIIKVLKEE